MTVVVDGEGIFSCDNVDCISARALAVLEKL